MQLGQAIVTVPRVKRQSGKVLRPTLFERLVLRIPESGDPARHFTIPRNGISLMSESEFLNAVRVHRENAGTFRDHAFVFVHGYNTAFDSALYRTAQIAFDLSDVAGSEADRVPFGTAFLYSWPSGGGTVDYVYDHGSARGAEEHFQKFLDLVIAKSGAKQIHLIAHSLGNSLLLNVLKNYRLPPSAGASINQIILAAPAIDAEEFGFIAEKGHLPAYATSDQLEIVARLEVGSGVELELGTKGRVARGRLVPDQIGLRARSEQNRERGDGDEAHRRVAPGVRRRLYVEAASRGGAARFVKARSARLMPHAKRPPRPREGSRAVSRSFSRTPHPESGAELAPGRECGVERHACQFPRTPRVREPPLADSGRVELTFSRQPRAARHPWCERMTT